MEIRNITTKNLWESFIIGQKPHSFLHSWNWGETNQKEGEKVFRLGIFEDDKIVAAAQFITISAKRGKFLLCPHGPIGTELTTKILKLITAKATEIARVEKCVFIRFASLLPDSTENEKMFFDQGYRDAPTFVHPELGWTLDIGKTEPELLTEMRKTTRYSIRKAQTEGAKIIQSKNIADVEKFWQLYTSTVDRQNFTPFPKKSIEQEFATFLADDQAVLFLGEYNGEVVASALVIFYGDCAFYHHGASNQKYPKVPVSYLLQWQAILEAKRRGCHFYSFWGVVPEEAKNHPWAGISLFKRGFGGFAEPYVKTKDFVLSPSYYLTYMIEFLRRKKRRL